VGAGKSQRKTGNLFKEAERLEREALQTQEAEAQQRRIQELLDLAGREEATWRWIGSLIGQKQAGPYDKSYKTIGRPARSGDIPESATQISGKLFGNQREVQQPTLMERFSRAGL
jgi:hypothetical protein